MEEKKIKLTAVMKNVIKAFKTATTGSALILHKGAEAALFNSKEPIYIHRKTIVALQSRGLVINLPFNDRYEVFTLTELGKSITL